MEFDALPLLNALEQVKHQVTLALNAGVPPRCGNCIHWEDTRTGKKPYGTCTGIMANCKTSGRLLTMPEFGCIYHENT